MNKEQTHQLIQDVSQKLIFLNGKLDNGNYPSKENLLHEVLNIREHYDNNIVKFKNLDNPDLLALQTALGNVDSIFEELITEIQKK